MTTGAGHRDHYQCHTGHLWPLLMVTSYGHLGPPLTATYGHLLRSVFVVCAPTLSRKKDKSHFCNLIKWGVRTCKQVIPEDLNNLHPEWRMTYNDTFCIQIRFWKGIYLILNPPWSSSFPPGARLSGRRGYEGLRWDGDCCVGNLQTPSYHLQEPADGLLSMYRYWGVITCYQGHRVSY